MTLRAWAIFYRDEISHISYHGAEIFDEISPTKSAPSWFGNTCALWLSCKPFSTLIRHGSAKTGKIIVRLYVFFHRIFRCRSSEWLFRGVPRCFQGMTRAGLQSDYQGFHDDISLAGQLDHSMVYYGFSRAHHLQAIDLTIPWYEMTCHLRAMNLTLPRCKMACDMQKMHLTILSLMIAWASRNESICCMLRVRRACSSSRVLICTLTSCLLRNWTICDGPKARLACSSLETSTLHSCLDL